MSMHIDEDLFLPLEEREPMEEPDDFDPEDNDSMDFLSADNSEKKKVRLSLYMAS